jgi:hypothetical protein
MHCKADGYRKLLAAIRTRRGRRAWQRCRPDYPAAPQSDGDGAEGARTPDLLAASQTLSQLSYSPKRVVAREFY